MCEEEIIDADDVRQNEKKNRNQINIYQLKMSKYLFQQPFRKNINRK